ncbi:nascent polypeptide-associated complex subunit alpha, muscle-specific form-like [Synchiropus splendidus]|uniref:nascent polypeptide-associated complex subunit alpha, muscle-specific form-like n=1 Tax=Synchiropus splendidus TaxID=270530 RepID=UPI00237E48CC|nr:nascent polypeptide-associated complex subunit alpha, muscle-specific form-like [Synchiropus splendidus]
MKPDGSNMDTTDSREPTEDAAVAEQSASQENITGQIRPQPEHAGNDAEHGGAEANGKPEAAAGNKVKLQAVAPKINHTSTSLHRMTRVAPSTNDSGKLMSKKGATAAPTAKVPASKTLAGKSSSVGAVAKRPTGAAAGPSSVKNQTKVPDKKPAGPTAATKTASAATKLSKPPTTNGVPKKKTDSVGVTRPQGTTTAGRSMAFKSAAARPESGAIPKTSRPASAQSASRPATSRPNTAPPRTTSTSAAAGRTATFKASAAPSTGRSTTAHGPKAAAAKKDVSQPPPAAAISKRPPAATRMPPTKKAEPPKPSATAKPSSVPKLPAKATSRNVVPMKPQKPANPGPAKKPEAPSWPHLAVKPLLSKTPPASPASKPGKYGTQQARLGSKPTQAVSPYIAVKKTKCPSSAAAARPAVAKPAASAQAESDCTVALAQSQPAAPSAPERISTAPCTETVPSAVAAPEATSVLPASPPQSSPVTSAVESAPIMESVASSLPNDKQDPAPVTATSPPVPNEEPFYLLTNQTVSKPALTVGASSIPQVQSANLNDDDDEEEREGSQLVSVSEMSGTTQPTEESRPGSAGPVGGSAWRAPGALLSELDSEEVSGSQQGASELSAPGVLEGTESTDDLGDGSLKGASAGSPDFEKFPDIPANDFEEDEDEEDDNDRVCDMDVGSERADEPQRIRHDNDLDDEEDDDVDMASEGVTESGLESYGNADEDDFAEDERLDNLNRLAQPPPPPELPSAPAAQWDQPNPFNPWQETPQPQESQLLVDSVSQSAEQIGAAAASPLTEPWQADSLTPTSTKAWQEAEADAASSAREEEGVCVDLNISAQTLAPPPASAHAMSLSSTVSSEGSTPEEPADQSQKGIPETLEDPGQYLEAGHKLGGSEEGLVEVAADTNQEGLAAASTSNPSSSSVTEDEASDTEGEAQLDDAFVPESATTDVLQIKPSARRCLSTLDEGDEPEADTSTPPSATSLASYGFDTTTTASTSNAQSTGESCIKSPGIFSLEELPEEAKELGIGPAPNDLPHVGEPQYLQCEKLEAEVPVEENVPGLDETTAPPSFQGLLREKTEDAQPPYYSAICEKSENSFPGFTALPHRRDHAAHSRTYCDLVKPLCAPASPPRLTCADLPPRSAGQQALSPQLRRLEQHQRQLQEMQQRRDQQNRPLEEAEQERKRREEEELRRKKEEAEEEIKRNEKMLSVQTAAAAEDDEEMKQRRDLELQLQQQQEELKQRQQIMQWQQELQQSAKVQTVVLSPSSGLCTIYEALESGDEEGEAHRAQVKEHVPGEEAGEKVKLSEVERPPPSNPEVVPSPTPPEPVSPFEMEWGKKVDIVQQLINQTLLLNGDSCSSLLLLPGGTGGKLSPLESSLWPALLPPLTPPSATVTSVSSFSPEAAGSSPQGEWTVVELETHH